MSGSSRMPPSQVTVAVCGSTLTFSNSRTSRHSWKAPISRRLPRNTLPSRPSSKRSHNRESSSALHAVTRCISLQYSCTVSSPCLVPTQRAPGLILDDAGFEEMALRLQVDHLAHPRERVGRPRVERVKPDLLAAPVGDEAQVLLEHRRVQPQHAARHGVLGIAVLELDRAAEQLAHLVAELRRPQVR